MSGLRLLCSVGLCVVCTVALLGCNEQKPTEPSVIRPVLTVTVGQPIAERYETFTGTVQPRYQASLGFQIPGRMVSRDIDVGQTVAKGQQLATIDPTLARLGIASAQSDLASARAQLLNAQAEDERKQKLIKTGVASQSQVDATTAARETAAAQVMQAQASLEKARMSLAYTRLASDVDGVVVSWQAQVGQVLSSGQNVVTIARPHIRDAVFDVPDSMAADFRSGAKFIVTLRMNEAISATAEVRDVAPQSDTATRTRRIWLTLLNPPDAFRLGTTVRITVGKPEPPHIDLPDSAIFDKDDQSLVWIIGPDQKAWSKPVKIAARRDGVVAITAGLASGDRIIIAGVRSLSDGQPIKISDQSAH